MNGDASGVRRRSAALFNNRHLVAIVMAISGEVDSSRFTVRQVASAADLPDSLVRPVVQRFLDADLVVEVARGAGARGPRQLRTREGPWAELQALCAALSDEDAHATARATP